MYFRMSQKTVQIENIIQEIWEVLVYFPFLITEMLADSGSDEKKDIFFAKLLVKKVSISSATFSD